MSLAAGARLGPYEIVASLGAGGMGEVYRARDTRLARDVAIKLVHPRFAADSEQLRRFEQEARAASQLDHPNILIVHDLGSHEGSPYIVSELLEGESLREKLGTPLPPRKAIEYVVQVAHGLAAAHEKGIVHRDLKPENLFVTKDGRVKILDFGIAKLTQPVVSSVPLTEALTASVPTEPGVVMGTVVYMSPEQVQGKMVDQRSDLFSLGVVLYELLSGGRPFQKETAAETLTAILREEPPELSQTNTAVSPGLERVVRHCLEKEPSSRFQSAADVAFALDSLSQTTTAGTAPLRTMSVKRRVTNTAFALVVAAVAVIAVLLVRGRQQPRPATGRFEIQLPQGYFLEPYRNALALSPDGKVLVFSAFTAKGPLEQLFPRWPFVPGGRQLFLRPLESLESRPVPGTEGGYQPVFSPDGRHVAFVVESPDETQTFLKTVPVAGGAVQTVCECNAKFGAAWAADGSILFASARGSLQKVPATGGTPEPATTLDAAAGEVSHRLPHLLPDGRTVLYTSLRWLGGMTSTKARIYAGVPGIKERKLLVEGGSDGRWAPPGVLLFAREGKLFAASLDSKARKLTGPVVPVLEGVRDATWTGHSATETGAAHVALAADGLVAWGPGSVEPPLSRTLVWVDASGNETPVEGAPKGWILSGRVSPDGQRALVSFLYPGMEAWVVDLARKASRRVTFTDPHIAIWGPGPDGITFVSHHQGPPGLYTRRLDAGPEEIATLWKPPDGSYLGVGSWSRDGRVLAFTREAASGSDIWLLEPGKEPRPFLSTRFDEAQADISPDGEWLVYTSDESGRNEVFAKALSGKGGALQVSAGEGWEPLWSRDGGSVYYWAGVEGKGGWTLFRVRVTKASDSLVFGVPERLPAQKDTWAYPNTSWDIAPDGRFLIVKEMDEADRRAWWGKLLSNRIVVDTGGVARLLADAKAAP